MTKVCLRGLSLGVAFTVRVVRVLCFYCTPHDSNS